MSLLSPLFRRLPLFVALSLGPTAAGLAASQNLPDLGEHSATVISPTQERRLGENFMREARRRMHFLADPEINRYIQSLGRRLVAHSDAPRQDFHFYVVQNADINAFAVPGGFVTVHTGLILAAQSEAELSSVLAHEIAHVTQRHIPRMMEESQRTTLPAMAALMAAILLGASGGQGADAAVALTSASFAQHQLNFSRAFEEEADRIGMQILAGSDFDPRAMPAFFERMQNLNRLNESSLPEFLRTHPVTTNRIADSRNRAERYAYRQTPDSPEFHRVRAKLRALTPDDAQEAVRAFRASLAQGKYRDETAERYGYVLALTRARAYDAARAEARKLVEQRPDVPAYRIAQAEVEFATGRHSQALGLYAAAARKFPGDPPLHRAHAQTLLNAGRPAEAYQLLKTAVREESPDPALYRLLARAAGESGDKIEAHRALAEAEYLSGNPDAAMEQLRLAARLAKGNFYLVSSIEARLGAIREEVALYSGKN